jgi:hypothetical protein
MHIPAGFGLREGPDEDVYLPSMQLLRDCRVCTAAFLWHLKHLAMLEKKVTNEPVVVATSPDLAAGDVEPQGFDAAGTKRLLRKLDWHIIPFMSLIYLYVFSVFFAAQVPDMKIDSASWIAPISAMLVLTISNRTSTFVAYSTMTASRFSSPSISPPRFPPI